MYYEYHLKDGTIEVSDTPNISSFPRVYISYWDDDINNLVEEIADVEVSYCIIKPD